MSSREEFEKVFPIPYNTQWWNGQYVCRSELADAEPAFVHQIRWQVWQVATEQGAVEAYAEGYKSGFDCCMNQITEQCVGEPVGEIQTYQSTGSHVSVTGILWYDGEPESGSKLYTHPTKPTQNGDRL